MHVYLRERFYFRIPSINPAIFQDGAKSLRDFCNFARPILDERFSKYERLTVPAMVTVTSYYDSKKWATDCDNQFIKPIPDALARHVFMGGHDGFREMVEVRKRTRLGTVGCLVEVSVLPTCTLCLRYERPPTKDGKCTTCGEKR